MARQRNQPTVQNVDLPLPAGDTEIPEIEDINPLEQSVGWQRAFQRAVGKGCSEKAARIFAEAHHEAFEDEGNTVTPGKKVPTVEELNEEIARLQQLREQVEGASGT